MKRSTIIITAIAASFFATALTPSFAAKKSEKTKLSSFIKTFKERKPASKNRKFILHRQGGTDTNEDLTKGRGVGFNGGFYGHSGGL